MSEFNNTYRIIVKKLLVCAVGVMTLGLSITLHAEPVLTLSVSGQAQPQLTDPAGKILGANATNGQLELGIEDAQLSLAASRSYIAIPNPMTGSYDISLNGSFEENLIIRLSYSDAVTGVYQEQSLYTLFHGAITSFAVALDPTNENPLVVTLPVGLPTEIEIKDIDGNVRVTWVASIDPLVTKYRIYARLQQNPLFQLLGEAGEPFFNTEHPVRQDDNGDQWKYLVVGVTDDGRESFYTNVLSNQIVLAAFFDVDTHTGPQPLTVEFSDDSIGDPTSWAWDFDNDGVIDSVEKNPIFTYNTAGKFNVRLTVIGLLGEDEVVQTNYIEVLADADGDGVSDEMDNCPNIHNSDQLDTELDGEGNLCDLDDDGDNLPDTFEVANGLNPLDASDADLDNDGDGLSNFEEFRIGTDINLADTDGDGINDNIDNNPLVFDEVDATLYSGQFYTLPDMNADGVAEIGILSVDVLEAKVRLEILNGKDRVSLDEVVWADNFSDTTLSLHVIADMNNNGVDEVGLFGIQDIANNEGKPQMFVRDLKTGNKVGDVYNWVANWKEVSALILDDMTGDGIAEIAIQGRFEEGNRPQLIVKIGNTNTILDTYSYPDLFVAPQYYQHSDIDGDGIKELATFGRLSKNNKIQVKIASGIDSTDKLKAYNFPDKWDDISWHRLDDSNGDGQDDWGMFGTLREDGRPQLVNKDGVSPVGALRIFAWPAEMENAQFFRIPDMNNDGVDEVAAAGRRSNNGRYQFQVQDGTDRNVLVANHNLNLDLESVTYHVLPDLSGDGEVEIGFMGINQQGEYELVIRHGDAANGEYASLNLGSDWQGAPNITSLGDTDDDGLPNLMVYGQNAVGEQLVITSL